MTENLIKILCCISFIFNLKCIHSASSPHVCMKSIVTSKNSNQTLSNPPRDQYSVVMRLYSSFISPTLMKNLTCS